MNGILVGVFVSVNIPNIKHWKLIAGISGGWQDWESMATKSLEIVLWNALMWFHKNEAIFFYDGCLFSAGWFPKLNHQALMPIGSFF